MLLDHNLSPRLATLLRPTFSDVVHVTELGMGRASDTEIWEHARAFGQTILSKDSDFVARALLRGAPPHIVWVRVGNFTTAEIATLLLRHGPQLHTLVEAPEPAVLVLDRLPSQ